MLSKRKIIVYIATSVDGFIARPDGSVDWLDRPRPKSNYGMGVFYKSIDTILWGTKTCHMAQEKRVTGSAFATRVRNYRGDEVYVLRILVKDVEPRSPHAFLIPTLSGVTLICPEVFVCIGCPGIPGHNSST